MILKWYNLNIADEILPLLQRFIHVCGPLSFSQRLELNNVKAGIESEMTPKMDLDNIVIDFLGLDKHLMA